MPSIFHDLSKGDFPDSQTSKPHLPRRSIVLILSALGLIPFPLDQNQSHLARKMRSDISNRYCERSYQQLKVVLFRMDIIIIP